MATFDARFYGRVWRFCPEDNHTCSNKKCLEKEHCVEFPAATEEDVKEAKKKPDKDDPMTWEVKES